MRVDRAYPLQVDEHTGSTTHDKQLSLRYAGTCRLCGLELPVGTKAVYDRAARNVRCIDCPPAHVPDSVTSGAADASPPPQPSGDAGASARREYERRKAKREERIRTKHPKLGGLILAVTDEPQSTKAWATGADGEEQLGQRLNELVGPSVLVLHDRRIPGTRANIDHIVVCPSGIFVIDAKRYKGRPQFKVEGGLLRPRVEKLLVGTRDCTKLVDGVEKQVALVRGALGDEAAVPVRGVLCFVEADWPLLGGSFQIRGIDVLWPRRLVAAIGAPGPLLEGDVARAGSRLAGRFPIA